MKLESLVSSQGTLAPHLRLRDVGSDLVALAKTAQLVGHGRPNTSLGGGIGGSTHPTPVNTSRKVEGTNFIHFQMEDYIS